MSLFLHYLSLPYLLEGIWFTVAVTALGLVGGLILGLVLAAMQLSRFWLLAAFARGYTVIFRGTPLILQMVFAYDALAADRHQASARSARPDWRSPPTKRRSSPKCCAPACSASTADRCWPGRRSA